MHTETGGGSITSAIDSGLRRQTEARRADVHEGRTIVVLGDSIPYGWGVSYEGSYPSRLERLQNADGGDTPGIRIINAGVPGDTVLMGATRYARDVTLFCPDVVLLAFGLNDGALRRTRFDEQRERLWLASHSRWARLWAAGERLLGQLAERAPWRTPGATDEAQEVIRQPLPRVSPRYFVAGLSDLIGRVRRDGAAPYLLTMTPRDAARLRAAQAQTYDLYDDLIRRVARSEGVRCLDLDAVSVPMPAEGWAIDGIHLTDVGQDWVARAVYEHL